MIILLIILLVWCSCLCVRMCVSTFSLGLLKLQSVDKNCHLERMWLAAPVMEEACIGLLEWAEAKGFGTWLRNAPRSWPQCVHRGHTHYKVPALRFTAEEHQTLPSLTVKVWPFIVFLSKQCRHCEKELSYNIQSLGDSERASGEGTRSHRMLQQHWGFCLCSVMDVASW